MQSCVLFQLSIWTARRARTDSRLAAAHRELELSRLRPHQERSGRVACVPGTGGAVPCCFGCMFWSPRVTRAAARCIKPQTAGGSGDRSEMATGRHPGTFGAAFAEGRKFSLTFPSGLILASDNSKGEDALTSIRAIPTHIAALAKPSSLRHLPPYICLLTATQPLTLRICGDSTARPKKGR